MIDFQWLRELANPDHYAFSWTAVPFFVAALCFLLAGLLILYWERGSRISRMFAVYSALFLLWCLGRGLIRLQIEPDLVVLTMRHVYAVACVAVPLLVEFALVMLRTDVKRRLLCRCNWLIGGTLALISIGSPWMIDGVHHYAWGMEPAHGPLGFLATVWMSALSLLLLFDARHAWRAALPGTDERKRVGLFSAAIVSLVLTVTEFATFSGVQLYPISFVSMLSFDLLTAYITRRFGLVEVNESLAAQQIAGLARGALLLLDSDGVIRAANAHTRRLLRVRETDVLGARAQTLLGDSLSLANLRKLAALDDAEAEKVLLYQHPQRTEPPSYLVLSVAAVDDPRGRRVAYACALRPLTEQSLAGSEPAIDPLIDTVTGLPLRGRFLVLLDAAAERRRRSSQYRCAVLVIGLERLRRINEDLGYAAGDKVLAELSQRLRLVLRAGDSLARVGSEELAVLVRAYQEPGENQALAEALCRALDLPVNWEDHRLIIHARVGIATGEQGHASGEELLRNASIAIFRAREKNLQIYALATGDTVQQRLVVEAQLRRALQRGELRVHYQPVMDLLACRVSGFEALVRWQHPQRGLLLPGEFIEIAEDVGLIEQIDLFVLRQACADLARLRRETGDGNYQVNVNLSEGALRSTDLLDRVDAALTEAGLPSSALRVELLEQVAQVGPLRGALQALRDRQIELHMDDFGSGYSALGRLHQVPISGIKIDRSLIQAMSQGEDGPKIVGAIVALARNLGLQVVAEGCGELSEVQAVRRLGCVKAQGFYFSQAVAYEALLPLLGATGPLAARLRALDFSHAA